MDQEKRFLKTLMCAQSNPDNFPLRKLTSASLGDRRQMGECVLC